jgi:hypothetical protein
LREKQLLAQAKQQVKQAVKAPDKQTWKHLKAKSLH